MTAALILFIVMLFQKNVAMMSISNRKIYSELALLKLEVRIIKL